MEIELLQEIDAGGYGVVWLAKDHQLGRNVAVKFLDEGAEDISDIFRSCSFFSESNSP